MIFRLHGIIRRTPRATGICYSASWSTGLQASLGHQAIVIEEEDAPDSHASAKEGLAVGDVPEHPVPVVVAEAVQLDPLGVHAIQQAANDRQNHCGPHLPLHLHF